MRNCPRAAEVRAVLAAEDPLGPDLSDHARGCADCTAAIAQVRGFERRLQVVVDEMVTDALPPDTLSAARMGAVPTRTAVLPRFVVSGLVAAAVVFAVVGVAATGSGIVEALARTDTPEVDPGVVPDQFTACYVAEAGARDPMGVEAASTTVVELCLADASQDLDIVDYGIVVGLNREATAATACLQARGWNVAPVLEPGGRFLVPPVAAPAGSDQQRYARDVESCTQEER
jgi:hypothetical protein